MTGSTNCTGSASSKDADVRIHIHAMCINSEHWVGHWRLERDEHEIDRGVVAGRFPSKVAAEDAARAEARRRVEELQGPPASATDQE
jgi:hypothetical protein